LASAMDVGNPSNMERLLQLHGGSVPTREALRVHLVRDDEIRQAIREGPGRWGEVWDPHTATAVVARDAMSSPHWVVVSTAHPAKFEQIVEPLIHRTIDVPASLAELLHRDMHYVEIEPRLEDLVGALSN
jgi:threonine synthase